MPVAARNCATTKTPPRGGVFVAPPSQALKLIELQMENVVAVHQAGVFVHFVNGEILEIEAGRGGSLLNSCVPGGGGGGASMLR